MKLRPDIKNLVNDGKYEIAHKDKLQHQPLKIKT